LVEEVFEAEINADDAFAMRADDLAAKTHQRAPLSHGGAF